LLRTVLDSAMLAGMVLFILAAASGFSWALTVAYLPQRLVDLLHGIHDDTALFLVGSIALLIVVGSLPSSSWRRCYCRSPAASGSANCTMGSCY
jgi:TRAP-type C4-dicarboxylate transport system permease large subunit